MLQTLYKTCELFGWNKGRTFPLEPLFQSKDAFRGGWSILLRYLPNAYKGDFNFLEEEWQYAIVLDACRYDLFKEVNTIPGHLEKRKSLGSMTGEWTRNAIKRDYKDMVLVTANPFLSNIRLGKKPFFKNISAWDIGWDDELHITPPWAMADLSKRMVKRFPEKRIIFWFMQPHHPFIESGFEDDWDMKAMVVEKQRGLRSIWTQVKEGSVTPEQVWKAYKHNLELTMPFVEKLIAQLNGEIIITSDHGNCFGELGLFCHPKEIHIPPLLEVPYLRVKTSK